MTKKVVFLILDNFADWEGAYLSSALLDEEMGEKNEVLWASVDKNPKKSLGNLTVVPDITVEEIPDDTDALILIGGASWRNGDNSSIISTVKSFRDERKILGFICDATYFAAKEGFLNDVSHTGNDPEEMQQLTEYRNPEGFRRENAVSDDKIITANGNNPVEFAAEVLKSLGLYNDQDIDMWSDFYRIGFWSALKKYGFSE